MPRLFSILLNLLIPLGGIFIAVLALEGGFRLAEPFLVDHTQSDRPKFYYLPEDASSFQHGHYSEQKPSGVFRVAVVGDSFSFGPDMQYDDVFAARLERMLNLNTQAGRAEVINYGVPGYSTSHEVADVQSAVARGADLVIVQITLNDAQLKPIRPTGITREGGFGELQIDERWYHYSRLASFVATRMHNYDSHTRYVDYYKELFSRKGCWTLFKSSVEKIARISRKKKVKVAALVFPLFGLPLDESYPFHDVHQKIENLLERQSIPYLDLFEAYKNIPLDRLQLIPHQDFHPNEIAHRIAAEELYAWLSKEEFVPESLITPKLYRQRKNPRLGTEHVQLNVAAKEDSKT